MNINSVRPKPANQFIDEISKIENIREQLQNDMDTLKQTKHEHTMQQQLHKRNNQPPTCSSRQTMCSITL